MSAIYRSRKRRLKVHATYRTYLFWIMQEKNARKRRQNMDRVMGNIDEFEKYVLDNVQRYLKEGEEAQIGLVNKNQHTYHGFMIIDKTKNNSIAPRLSIESVLDYYDFTDYGTALEKLVSVYRRNQEENRLPDVLNGYVFDDIYSYDFIKDKVDCKLVGVAGNSAYLNDVMHTYVADMALTYHINLGEKDGQTVTMPISKEYASKMALSEEVLYKLAQNNMEKLHPMRFCSFDTMLKSLMGVASYDDDTDESLRSAEMLMLSNADFLNGAALITHPEYMDYIHDKLQTDNIYILPSSVHEVMIANVNHPNYDDFTPEELLDYLTNMVCQVNEDEVADVDFLSNNVYKYDFKQHELYLAKDEQNRNAELAANVNMRLARAAGR
jgi:hypothetical protein